MANQISDKQEEPRRTKSFRKFKGVVNNSARIALPEDAWFYLENVQPIGDANAQVVPNIGPAIVDLTAYSGGFVYPAFSIYWQQYAFVGGKDCIFSFLTSGRIVQTVIGSGASTVAGFCSSSGGRLAQWKNNLVLFIDPTYGYSSWDGTTITPISGTGVPTAGTDIAVAFGRVWILNGRLLTFSGANDYSAASFTVANGAGSLALVDPTIRNTITRLFFQNGYLYIIGPTGINVISDVYVPSGASPPTPLFTNLNIQAIIGCDQPGSVYAMNQALVFANKNGVYYLYGTNAKKISSDIDGTWQYLDFTQTISGGQAVINQILCSAFLVKRLNDPVFGSNQVLAMFQDEKWWFANFGALTFVVSGLLNNQPTLFGMIGPVLYQLFADPTTAPMTTLKTPLWGMEDELADKQALRAGFEVSPTFFGTQSFSMTLDTPTLNAAQLAVANTGNVAWVNNAGATVTWVNSLGNPVTWISATFGLYNAAAPGMYSKYLGATITGGGAKFQLSAVYIDYKLGARWN